MTPLQKTLTYFVGAAIPALAVWSVIVNQQLGGSLVAAVSGGAIIGLVCMLLAMVTIAHSPVANTKRTAMALANLEDLHELV